MKSFNEIRKILRSHEDELRVRYGITNLSVFGSVARQEVREGSDIDIIADIPLHVNLFELMGAELFLSDLLGIDVDLISRKEIRQELRDRILAESVAI